VKVLQTTVLRDENGVAAVVRLHNDSARPLHEVPIAIALHEPGAEPSIRTTYPDSAPR
jgi:hypothetical protein